MYPTISQQLWAQYLSGQSGKGHGEQDAKSLLGTPRSPVYEPFFVTPLVWIRLCHIEPGNIDQPAVCHLTHHELKDGLEYRCLSYAWGDSTDERREIMVNGHTMVVMGNLYQALRQLRQAKLSTPIWIDALCIDQGNVPETSVHVAMMGMIYCAAVEVLIPLRDVSGRCRSGCWPRRRDSCFQGNRSHSRP
jgi:hypothetical protein